MALLVGPVHVPDVHVLELHLRVLACVGGVEPLGRCARNMAKRHENEMK